MKELRANLLIGNNIMFPGAIVIDLEKRNALIGVYGVTIKVNVKQRGQFFARKLPLVKIPLFLLN